MYKLVFILSQYVALCGAFTSPNPNTVGWQVGTDPLFGGSFWGNQMNFDPFFPPTNLPFNDVVPSTPPTNPPKNQATTQSPKAQTTVLSYDTANPSAQTAPPTVPPTSTNQKAEASISLQELIRLAARNSNSHSESITSKIFLKMMGPVSNTDSKTSVTNTEAQTTEKSKPSQTIVSTAPSADTQNVSTTTPTGASPSSTSTPAPTTTPKPTTTTQSTTTTTTTIATTTTTTPAPTTTTTTTITPPTTKPLVKMTLAEIINLSKFKLPINKQTTTTTTTPKPKGCHYKGHFYTPLEEIERGQTGNWCYGSYCNHEGTVIHWDDHKCSTSPSTPPTATKTKSDAQLDVGAVAGALTQSEIDALATVPGMRGIAETLRQYYKKSTTESPTTVNAAIPPVRMPSIGMANGMGSMNMAGGGAGMGNPSMIELARMAGIDIGSAGGASGMGEMGGMSGMGGMGGAAGGNMAELAAIAGIELPGGSGGASGMGGMGGLGGAGGGNMAELAAMAGIELPSGSGGASGMGGMSGLGGLGGAAGSNMAELAAMAGIELPGGSGGGTAGMSGMGGGSGSMAELAGIEGMSGMGAGMGGGGMGCFVNGRHYAPGTDIENHRDYGRCYGSYCDFNSKVVHWNDRCRAMPQMSQPTQTMSMRQLQQLDLI